MDFQLTCGDKLRVYTTRPDTLFGATYMVVSPEHPMLETHKDKIENYSPNCGLPFAGGQKEQILSARN